MSGATVTVEMGETRVSRTSVDRLVAHGLGACIGLCLYDAAARLAAMVHIVLPETIPLKPQSSSAQKIAHLPGKCADTAITHALQQIVEHGAQIERLRAVIAGGAQIFAHATGTGNHSATLSRLEIGPRNVLAVRSALEAERIPLIAEEVGGNYGRNLSFCVGTGEIYVRRIGSEEQLLASLGNGSDASTHRREEALVVGR
jgi:chemotaxis protein CheD